MPIVSECTVRDCTTLTIGPRCIDHEHCPARVFVRGRPSLGLATTAVADAAASLATTRALRPVRARRPSVRVHA